MKIWLEIKAAFVAYLVSSIVGLLTFSVALHLFKKDKETREQEEGGQEEEQEKNQ